ncbi:MAG: M56 family metallopeptidase, partial [Oscillospiraceae bacterium]
MTNIWDFLLQTATVSVAAALLLLVKAIFRDKLSPRWQYGVWSLLALRLLLPAGAGRNVLLPLPKWVEQLKTAAEGHLNSAYSGVYEPVGPEHVLPLLKGAPRSLTDWLMLAYVLGVLLYLACRLVSDIRLRRLLGGGRPISPAMEAKLAAVCGKYHLKTCRAVELEGIKSAFVCGVLRPVLVLPAGEDTDEKVLLHELLHLRCLDIPQGVFWCVLGALHWCNPFLRYVFARIGNDMESLCDQRVLERLEGEER